MESNDSPEIPDRGETTDIPGLPSGAVTGGFELGQYDLAQLYTWASMNSHNYTLQLQENWNWVDIKSNDYKVI